MTGEVEILSKLMRLLTEFSRSTQQIKAPFACNSEYFVNRCLEVCVCVCV